MLCGKMGITANHLLAHQRLTIAQLTLDELGYSRLQKINPS